MSLGLALLFGCSSGSNPDVDTTNGPSSPGDAAGYAVALDLGSASSATTGQPLFPVSGVLLDLEGQGYPTGINWSLDSASGVSSGVLAVASDGSFEGTLTLSAGDNSIAFGTEPGMVLAAVDVTYNPGYEFGGQLVLEPDVAYVAEQREITALIALTDPTTDVESVRLVRVDQGSETTVAMLRDDGDLGNGDEIEGDGVFTGRFDVEPIDLEGLEYRVKVDTNAGVPAMSERFDMLVAEHLTEAELNTILGLQGEKQAQITEASASGDLPAVLDAIVVELLGRDDVLDAGISEGERGVWVLYESGIAGVIYPTGPSEKGGGAVQGEELVFSPSLRASPLMGAGFTYPEVMATGNSRPQALNYRRYSLPLEASGAASSGTAAQVENPENVIGSNKVFALAAQYFDWGEGDDVPKIVDLLEEEGCFDVTYIKYTSPGSGSLADFLFLGDYGIVLISSHGDSFFKGAQGQFGWNGPGGQVVIHSNQQVTPGSQLVWEDDLKQGRLVLWNGMYGVLPGFIKKYSDSLPNSLVYTSICRGALNGTLASAFMSSGAGAFLSYSDYVDVSFCVATGVPFFEGLLESDATVADAFIPGQVENDSDPAEFRLFGSQALSIQTEGLQDGSFESGSISQAWTTEGDGRVVSSLGSFGPTDGDFMGIISTGLGFTTSSGSIRQKLCLGEGESIAFDWNFLSEEFLEWCGTVYQDAFEVTLTDTSDPANRQVVLYTFVDELCSSVGEVSIGFDKGDVYATGWQSSSVAIEPNLLGKQVWLEFACSDVGDSIFDTAVLIDDVQIMP